MQNIHKPYHMASMPLSIWYIINKLFIVKVRKIYILKAHQSIFL